MGKWIHRLTNIDPMNNTADCDNCGVVAVVQRSGRPKCTIADKALNKRRKFNLRNGLSRVGEGHCDICGLSTVLRRDHDHKCCPDRASCKNCTRGFLCQKCNLGLGHFNDDIELIRSALSYLEAYESKQLLQEVG